MCGSGSCSTPAAFSLIWSLIGFVIWLLVIGWIYSDAEAQARSGCLWAALFFFFGFLALAIYLIFFHGISALDRHRAVNRGNDLGYRSMYRQPQPDAGTWKAPNMWGTASAASTPATADPDFRDLELDRLIKEGKLSEAREYLRDMINVAKEMGDSKGLANYRQYESRISRAAARSNPSGFATRM